MCHFSFFQTLPSLYPSYLWVWKKVLHIHFSLHHHHPYGGKTYHFPSLSAFHHLQTFAYVDVFFLCVRHYAIRVIVSSIYWRYCDTAVVVVVCCACVPLLLDQHAARFLSVEARLRAHTTHTQPIPGSRHRSI